MGYSSLTHKNAKQTFSSNIITNVMKFSFDIDMENRLSQDTTVLVESYTVSTEYITILSISLKYD